KNINITKLNHPLKELTQVVKQFTRETKADVVLIKLNGTKVASMAEPDDSSPEPKKKPDARSENHPPKEKMIGQAFGEPKKTSEAKRFDDAAKLSSGLSKLVALRERTNTELETAKEKTPDAPEVLALDSKLKQIDAQLNKYRSIAPQAKGQEYV